MPPKRAQKSQNGDKKTPKSGKDPKKSTVSENQKKNNKSSKSATAKTGDTKMTLCTVPTMGMRSQTRERRPGRPPSGKRLSMAREMTSKVRSAYKRSLDPCDNSNDSGLGFDHHADQHQQHLNERLAWNGNHSENKRLKMDIKLENEDVNDRYCFPETLKQSKDSTTLIRTAPAGSIPSLSMNNNPPTSSGRVVPRCVPVTNRQLSSTSIPLTTQLSTASKYVSDVSLMIVKQPEQQHRARYQTEGSRGAVKDRDGNGFPIVQLIGYYKPAALQVFIGTDVGKVTPHMFYQACKVSGKNSTPCMEKKIEGTCVIELQLDPSKDMTATCDCVGILKERNVDVEHRFPDQLGNRSKKKSTRCRMIFRTTLTHDDGTQETLQVCSQPIVCTQPPGIPEICKKSLTSCPATGGLELFVLGKNFLKDTKVYFQQIDEDRHVRWEQVVVPDKEYLQQTHFVCVVPPYRRSEINEPITVRLCVVSSGKTSEPHQFVYTPIDGAVPSVHVDSPPAPPQTQFFNKMLWPSKREQDLGMMPPPDTSLVPMSTTRRPSLSLSNSDNLSPPLRSLKQEYIDENSQSSMDPPERFRHISESSMDVHPGDSNMSMINDNSIDILSHMSDSSNLSERRSSQEDNSCGSVLQHCNSVVTDRLVMAQPLLMQQGLLTTATQSEVSVRSPEELKVMDLRMKMPMATVADLVSSTAPSMATLQSFGVTEPTNIPLPAQSAQSVENFLTNIENKNLNKIVAPLASIFPAGAENILIAKSEAAAIAEQTLTEQTAPITTMSSMETSLPVPINTEKLDQLVNSTVESHIGSPTRSDSITATTETIIHDVMLARPPVMVAPMINTTPILSQDPHTSPTLSPAIILNSQISPSLMCRSTPDSLSICQGGVEPSPITSLVATNDPEKVVLLKAAVDLLETTKKISELESRAKIENKEPIVNRMVEDIITMASTGTSDVMPTNQLSQLQQGSNFVQATPNLITNEILLNKTLAQDNKSDFVIPVPVKEITGIVQVDKKAEEGMIPQSFTSLTENELINFINPSCFDQV